MYRKKHKTSPGSPSLWNLHLKYKNICHLSLDRCWDIWRFWTWILFFLRATWWRGVRSSLRIPPVFSSTGPISLTPALPFVTVITIFICHWCSSSSSSLSSVTSSPLPWSSEAWWRVYFLLRSDFEDYEEPTISVLKWKISLRFSQAFACISTYWCHIWWTKESFWQWSFAFHVYSDVDMTAGEIWWLAWFSF